MTARTLLAASCQPRGRRNRMPALVAMTSGPVVMTMMVTFHWRLVVMVVVMVVVMMLLLNYGAVIIIEMVVISILSAVIALCHVNVVDLVKCNRHGCF